MVCRTDDGEALCEAVARVSEPQEQSSNASAAQCHPDFFRFITPDTLFVEDFLFMKNYMLYKPNRLNGKRHAQPQS